VRAYSDTIGTFSLNHLSDTVAFIVAAINIFYFKILFKKIKANEEWLEVRIVLLIFIHLFILPKSLMFYGNWREL